MTTWVVRIPGGRLLVKARDRRGAYRAARAVHNGRIFSVEVAS